MGYARFSVRIKPNQTNPVRAMAQCLYQKSIRQVMCSIHRSLPSVPSMSPLTALTLHL
jgi:hypothetical protein